MLLNAIRYKLLIFMFLIPFGVVCEVTADELENVEKQILIIHSFQENYEWTQQINRGIEDQFQKENIPVNVFIYYLDCKRVTDETARLSLLKDALHTYKTENLDLVIVCDDCAYQAYLQSGSTVSKKVPTIFCSVDQFDLASISSFKNITGIPGGVEFAKTYDLGLQLFPQTKQVAIVTDNSHTGTALKNEAINQLKSKVDTSSMIILDGHFLDTAMLLDTLNSLPSNTLILMSVWNVDATNAYRKTSTYYPSISRSSKAPLLVVYDVGFNEGVLGGYVSSPYDLGRIATEMGAEVLRGRNVSDIPVNQGRPGKLMLDWKQLMRWNVDFSKIPADAIIINKPQSFADRYLKYIIIVTLSFVVLLLLLGFITLYHLKYRSAVKSGMKLKAENETLAERYRRIFNNHYKGMFLFSETDNKIVEVNEYTSDLLGYTQDELLTIHPSRFSSAFDEYGVITTQEPGIYDVTITKKDGSKIYANATRIYFKEKGKDYIYIIYIDRTELHKVEEQLIKQKKELDITLKSIEEGVISTDKNKRIFNINRAALDFLGLEEPADQYLGKQIDDIFSISERCELQNIETLMDEAFVSGETVPIPEKTLIIKRKDNSKIYISGNISNIFKKNSFYGFVFSFRDITEEHTQREYMALALQSSNVFRWFYNIERKSFSFGYEFHNMNGKTDDSDDELSREELYEMIHPDDLYLVKEGFDGTSHNTETSFSIQVRIDFFKEGYEWWELRCTSLSGDNQRLLGIFMNINSLKHAETELVNARNQAMQSDKLKSAFLANMSHEIRTPLNGIVGFANLLASDEDYLAEERQVFISTINSNCQILLGLISDILDLSRIESGTLSFHMQNCSVNELIENVVATHRVSLSGSVRIEAALQSDNIVIVSDRIRLSQLLTNLVTNAVKFTKEGVITVGYEVVENKDINFYIQDTGCGISEDDRHKIFGRFYKIDEFAQGAGLGLSICKIITERFGGTISVDSCIGEGTRFTVSLPYIPVSDELDGKNLLMDNLSGQAKSKSNSTILVAEDEDQNFNLINAVLSSRYHIIRALDGVDVVNKFRAEDVDLILMDVKMPNKSGIEALKEIRSISKRIPVIMQTAYAYDADKIIAEEAGCNDFMTKPLDTALLVKLVEKYIGLN